MAATADVVRASPIDELVRRRRREQHVSGRRAIQCGPDPRERIGVLGADEATVLHLGGERRQVSLDAPQPPAGVQELAARGEAELPARTLDDALALA